MTNNNGKTYMCFKAEILTFPTHIPKRVLALLVLELRVSKHFQFFSCTFQFSCMNFHYNICTNEVIVLVKQEELDGDVKQELGQSENVDEKESIHADRVEGEGEKEDKKKYLKTSRVCQFFNIC